MEFGLKNPYVAFGRKNDSYAISDRRTFAVVEEPQPIVLLLDKLSKSENRNSMLGKILVLSGVIVPFLGLIVNANNTETAMTTIAVSSGLLLLAFNRLSESNKSTWKLKALDDLEEEINGKIGR